MRILWILLALAQAVSSPAATGSLMGSVTADGAPVRHARVVVQAPNGPIMATSTDSRGEFRFDRLAPGRYSVRAEKPGFVRLTTPDAPVNQMQDSAQVLAAGVATAPIHLARAAAIVGTLNVSRGSPSDQSVNYVAVERVLIDRNGVAQTDVFTAKADSANQFRIGNLPEGRYRVRTFLPDRSYWYARGTLSADDADLFTLTSGQSVDIGELRWPLESIGAPPPSPKRVIEGRIFDEFGDPAPWVQVHLLHARVIAGHRYLEPLGRAGGTASAQVTQGTDDLGRFRFEDVPLGDAYLVALPEPFGRQDVRADAELLTGLQPTFYPGTDRAAEARPIRIEHDTIASDVTLAMAPAVTGSLNIVNTDEQGRPYIRQVLGFNGFGMLFRVQDGRLQPALRAPLAWAARKIPAGDYMAWYDNELIPIAIAPGAVNEITLRDSPVSAAGRTSGVVKFDGPAPPLDQIRVEYRPADPGYILAMAGGAVPLAKPVGSDARFSFPPWTRGLSVIRAIAPEGWALARVTTGGRDITDVATNLAGLDDLTVELTSRVGRVVGKVVEAGQPSVTLGVVLYAEAANLRTFPSRFVHLAQVDGLGNFKISNVLPGRYLMLALPDKTATDVDLDWLDEMRAAALPVMVSEGTETRLVVQMSR